MELKKPENPEKHKATTRKTRTNRPGPAGDDIYRTLIESLPQKIFYKNKDLVYVSCNDNFAADFNISADNITGKTDYDLYPRERADRYRAEDLRVMDAGKTESTEECYIRDGREYYIQTVITPVRDSGGIIIGVFGIFWDITARKIVELELDKYRKDLERQVRERTTQLSEINVKLEAEVEEHKLAQEALIESEERYRGLVENINDIIYTLDINGNVTYISPAVERMGSYKASELTGQPFSQFIYPDDLPELMKRYGDMLTGRTEPWECRMLEKDGKIRYVRTSSRLVFKDGKIAGTTGLLIDITENKKLERKLADMAAHDFLTGLPNRALLHDRINVAMAQAVRKNRKLAVMVMDLDHFKGINDEYGHLTGDKLLQNVASRLTGIIRKGDTAARLGGDEFVLLLPDLKEVEEAMEVARRTLDVVAEPIVLGDIVLHVTTSIGVAVCSANDMDGEALLKKADAAMYEVKNASRNGYALFSGPAGDNPSVVIEA
ncbi:MAG: diguanylate cyclase [Chloroflexi bacterium]|nr:diguanylate cyclase [Chloroflexota bacterium]